MSIWNKIERKLKDPLPGYQSQIKMAPQYRKIYKDNEILHFKQSAVLILLYLINNKLNTVIIIRPDNGRHHSGQLCFPGGKWEQIDSSFQDTALRETEEELGISSNGIRILGKLSTLSIPVSSFVIHPYVGCYLTHPKFSINHNEVANILEVEISKLQMSENIKKYTSIIENRNVYIPYYDIVNYKLWGASAMIMSEFIDIL